MGRNDAADKIQNCTLPLNKIVYFECQGHKIAEEANVTDIFQMFLLLSI